MCPLVLLCGREGAGESRTLHRYLLTLPCTFLLAPRVPQLSHLQYLTVTYSVSLPSLPNAGLRRRFQGMVRRILGCKGWNEALDVMDLMPLSPTAWTARLRQSWQNSLAKGYHSNRTNWDR